MFTPSSCPLCPSVSSTCPFLPQGLAIAPVMHWPFVPVPCPLSFPPLCPRNNSTPFLSSIRPQPQPSHPSLPHPPFQALANTAWALTLMEAPLTPAWRAAFLAAAAAAAPGTPPASLAQILWAAARLKLQPPATWVERLAAQLLISAGQPVPWHAPAARAQRKDAVVGAANASASSPGRGGGEGGAAATLWAGGQQGSAGAEMPAQAVGVVCLPQDLANAVFAVAQLGRRRMHPHLHPQVRGARCLLLLCCSQHVLYAYTQSTSSRSKPDARGARVPNSLSATSAYACPWAINICGWRTPRFQHPRMVSNHLYAHACAGHAQPAARVFQPRARLF